MSNTSHITYMASVMEANGSKVVVRLQNATVRQCEFVGFKLKYVAQSHDRHVCSGKVYT